MAASISFSSSGLIPEGLLAAAKYQAQGDMAYAFAATVDHNFGPGHGEDRPTEWPILSSWYAEMYHDGDRTPTLVLDGILQGSIDIDDQSPVTSVYTDCPYASKHQYGDPENHLPARPFFPMEGDEGNETITQQTEQKCLDAAEKAIVKVFSHYFAQ